MIGIWTLFDEISFPSDSMLYFTEENPFWTLLILLLRGWVIDGNVVDGVSGASTTSMFEVISVGFMNDDWLFDDRIEWDSRVLFRFGDKCNEDVDVDVAI